MPPWWREGGTFTRKRVVVGAAVLAVVGIGTGASIYAFAAGKPVTPVTGTSKAVRITTAPPVTEPPPGQPPGQPPLPPASGVAASLDATNTGWDGAKNSGWAGAARPAGSLTIDDGWLASQNGGSRVVEGLDVSGSITVTAADVVLRYCRVNNGSADYGVDAHTARNFTIEWCTIVQNQMGKGIFAGGFTARRLNISGGEDGIHTSVNPGAVLIEESWVHDQYHLPGYHSDSYQSASGPAGGIILRRNKLINHFQTSNAPIQIRGDQQFVPSVLIEDNYLYGGVYSIALAPDKGEIGTVVIRNNQAVWDSPQFGFAAGAADSWSASGDVWVGKPGSGPIPID